MLLFTDKMSEMEKAEAIKDIHTINGNHAHQRSKEMDFWALNKTERLRRLQSFKKFLVVREPFERLLSAYRNKLEPEKDDYFGRLSRMVHKNVQAGHLRRKRADQATFKEFLEALLDHKHRIRLT